MFDIFGRKRIRELEKSVTDMCDRVIFYKKECSDRDDKLIVLEFSDAMRRKEIQGYKDRIMKLEKLLNFVTVNKPAKRRNDVLLASLACGKSTVTPVMEYLKRKGIKDPDGGDYKRSTVQDILKPPATTTRVE